VDRGVKEMLVTITSFGMGAIAVVNEKEELIGLVTDYDIRRVLESERNILSLNIADIMNPHPRVVTNTEKAIVALEMMRNQPKPIAVLPVVDSSGKALGIVQIHDLISAGL
jgi:arabinose-5-phosphate isomerase